MTGCSAYQEEILLTDQSVHYMSQKGSIIFASPEESAAFKLRFDYHQVGSNAYAMTLYPFLMSPIRFSLTNEGDMTLIMNGVSYGTEESMAMLNAYAPEFPWDHLTQIVAIGDLHNEHWAMESWEPSRFKMNYAGSTVEWVVESSKFS